MFLRQKSRTRHLTLTGSLAVLAVAGAVAAPAAEAAPGPIPKICVVAATGHTCQTPGRIGLAGIPGTVPVRPYADPSALPGHH